MFWSKLWGRVVSIADLPWWGAGGGRRTETVSAKEIGGEIGGWGGGRGFIRAQVLWARRPQRTYTVSLWGNPDILRGVGKYRDAFHFFFFLEGVGGV